MLYLIGLGLNEKGITLEGKEAIKKCDKIYLEGYTVDFPYSIPKLEGFIDKKIVKLGRGDVESNKLVNESKKHNVALLVYGCPLFATTHISLLMDMEKAEIKTKIIYSASVFDAVAESGLQLYKFGKISSMPRWQKNFEPDSFLEFVSQNKSIGAHSLILIDIGLDFDSALDQLEKALESRNIKINKLFVCSSIGTSKSKMIYGKIEDLRIKGGKIDLPYCFIIPGEMHFLEKDAIEKFSI
ncbi:Diphthine synthase [uncultured archaeon]|nr:Diphthine synthase [uncultured archaeon]